MVALQLNIYSRRWDRRDPFSIKRTEDGWIVEHLAIGGPCDATGAPYLFDNLRQDSVNYPADLSGYLEWLWRQARDLNMSDEQVQEHLDVLAEWIEIVEKASPSGLWTGYNSGRAERNR